MNNGSAPENAVALVHMPWASLARPSIALGILKQCANQAGFAADVHYLNMSFGEAIGFRLFEQISNTSPIYPEWFFSLHLFGPEGLAQVSNSWQDMQATKGGRTLAEQLVKIAGNSEQTCLEVAAAVPAFLDRCVDEIEWGKYRAVGFSVTFAQTTASLLLAKRLKEKYPSLAIIFGGANVDAEMGFELLRGCEWVDYVVHGEAERSFPALLEAIARGESGASVPGVSARTGGELVPGYAEALPLDRMDESPTPDYSDFFRETKRTKLEKTLKISLPVESSRGCWWGAKHHCTFCGLNGSTMSFRKKSAERVYGEIMEMSDRYRCLNFNMVDNILDMGYFHDLLPALAAADIDLTLFYEIKANMTREQVRLLAASGITVVQPGIESLSTELLRLMRKGITAIQNVQFLKWCAEFNIKPYWNLLYGFPGEEESFYKEYPTLLRQLFHLYPPSGVFPITFERFSPYHFEREKFNLRLRASNIYSMLYPESTMEMDKVAYYFEGMWDGKANIENQYIELTKSICQEWGARRQTRPTNFFYQKGPHFLTLYDNRPLAGEAQPTLRRFNLDEVQSKVYLFCDQHRSFKSIHRMLSAELDSPPAEEAVRHLLDQFVGRGFMYREGDRYLSLATRRASETAQSADGGGFE